MTALEHHANHLVVANHALEFGLDSNRGTLESVRKERLADATQAVHDTPRVAVKVWGCRVEGKVATPDHNCQTDGACNDNLGFALVVFTSKADASSKAIMLVPLQYICATRSASVEWMLVLSAVAHSSLTLFVLPTHLARWRQICERLGFQSARLASACAASTLAPDLRAPWIPKRPIGKRLRRRQISERLGFQSARLASACAARLRQICERLGFQSARLTSACGALLDYGPLLLTRFSTIVGSRLAFRAAAPCGLRTKAT